MKTFTALAQDAYGHSHTETITVNPEASTTLTYHFNGNLASDGNMNFHRPTMAPVVPTIFSARNSFLATNIFPKRSNARLHQTEHTNAFGSGATVILDRTSQRVLLEGA
jgi:hypothetical protein